MSINLQKFKKVYFIGIGGIGVSAVARIFLQKNIEVVGSDLVESVVTKDLIKKGAKIFVGKHDAKNLPDDVDLVVHTVAATSDNPELVKAKKSGIKTMSYPEVLGELTKNKYLIAVSGTHGKTTTTAMIGLMLVDAGLDPTVIVGSNIKEFDGNARLGKSDYYVIEADEYRRAFLNYKPKIAVVLNIEFDHPDCYKDLDDVKDAFNLFIARADYIVDHPENLMNDLNLKLKVPGKGFLLDALAAREVGRILEIDDKIIKESLENYQGSWRRFEIKGEINGVIVVDDYAHHPTEVKSTLQAAKEKYPDKNIVCVFQPHHQDRFNALFDEFVGAFNDCDRVILTDVYHVAGREENRKQKTGNRKTSEDLAKKIGQKVIYVGGLDEAFEWLKKNVKPGDVVLTMGAGTITEVSDKLIKNLKLKNK
ncbi:MAG: UDP-N-acetylmuramate--L-alanine ligase [Patescibacteria group bacterium]|jgi:UDP-N-acetylmuramate--alanine ligase